MDEIWKNKTAPLIIHTHTVQSWRGEEMNNIQNIAWLYLLNSSGLVATAYKRKTKKASLFFFLAPLNLIFWVSAPMESFAFELLNAALTVPSPPVTRRAGITLTNTVIEPQLVTGPPPPSHWAKKKNNWYSSLLRLLGRSRFDCQGFMDTAGCFFCCPLPTSASESDKHTNIEVSKN